MRKALTTLFRDAEDAFKIVDDNNDGIISYLELGKLLRENGV